MKKAETKLYVVKDFIVRAASQQEADDCYPELIKAAEESWLAEYQEYLKLQKLN